VSRQLGKAKTLAEAWRLFEAAAELRGAGNDDLVKARLAFYAGAASMFELVQKAAEPRSEDECVRLMSAIDKELETFVVTVATSGARES